MRPIRFITKCVLAFLFIMIIFPLWLILDDTDEINF
jgi:hypothetical protein